LEELRDRYAVPPLDPSLVAADHGQVQRSDVERPGMKPPPPVSSVPDQRPPSDGPVAPLNRRAGYGVLGAKLHHQRDRMHPRKRNAPRFADSPNYGSAA